MLVCNRNAQRKSYYWGILGIILKYRSFKIWVCPDSVSESQTDVSVTESRSYLMVTIKERVHLTNDNSRSIIRIGQLLDLQSDWASEGFQI